MLPRSTASATGPDARRRRRVDTDLAAAAAAELDAALVLRRHGTQALNGSNPRRGGQRDSRGPDPRLAPRQRRGEKSGRGCLISAHTPDPTPQCCRSSESPLRIRHPPPPAPRPAARTCTRSPSAPPPRPCQRLRGLHAARLVEVRRAHRRHEVGVTVAVDRHRAAPPQLAPQQRQQLLERRPPRAAPTRPARGATARPASSYAPRLCREVIVETTSRTPSPSGTRSRPRGARGGGSSPSSRPLEPAQLARPRPPDPARFPLLIAWSEARAAPDSPPDSMRCRMCRVFGCVASEPVSIRHELLEAENPLIRQSEDHDSGWGMAVYERADGAEPRLVRFPEAAYGDDEFRERQRAARPHLQRARPAGDDGRARAREHAPVLRSAATRSATTGRSCATRACSSPACAGPRATPTPSTSSTC